MEIKEFIRELKVKLSDEKQAVYESWGRGNFTGPTSDETVQLNSKYLGKVEALDELLFLLETYLEEV